MLESIKEALFSFFEPFMSIFDFIIGIGEDLVYVAKLLSSLVLKMPRIFSWLPPPVISIILTIFAIVVIYKILGREG